MRGRPSEEARQKRLFLFFNYLLRICAYMQNVHFIFLIDNIAQITTALWHFVFCVFCLCVCVYCAKVVVLPVKPEVFVFVTELVGIRDS